MLARARAYPCTREDHPWGETVVKVKEKVFVFFGRESEDVLRFSVKLPASGERWLDQPCAEPCGYGMGKHGWVTFSFETHDVLANAELFALLDESFRAVAPKAVLQELAARSAPPVSAVKRSSRAAKPRSKA
jgi:predicted DNA-binding protein (MmcQ/YjbR family)